MHLENKTSLGASLLLPTEQFLDQKNQDQAFVLKFESSSITSEWDYLRNKNAVQVKEREFLNIKNASNTDQPGYVGLMDEG